MNGTRIQTISQTPLAIAISLATFLASPLTQAQHSDWSELDSPWYGGLNTGLSRESIHDDRIANDELNGGLVSITDDKEDNGYKIFAGYQLNEYISLEGGFFDLGEFGFRALPTPPGALKNKTKNRGFNIDLIGFLPITERFSSFIRGGAHYIEVKDRFEGSEGLAVADVHRREQDSNFKWGAGLHYDLTEKVAMRLEGERYYFNDVMSNNGSINLYSLGLIYRFGDKNSNITQSEPARSKPVIHREPSAPQATADYCSVLDIQFEINQDDIQREELERLGVVGAFLKKYPNADAVIEGHTDNVGSAMANQTLSRHRAESVLNYLVTHQQIARSRLSAVGYGDTRPIANNNSEEGKRMNRRINTVIPCAKDIAGLNPAVARVTMGMLIEFDVNSAEVMPKYHRELAKIATFLRDNSTISATIEGHTANLQTTPALGQEISQRRAQNVVNYLINNEGISSSRLTAQGFGQSRRYSYNTSAEGQQENRRVNIIFSYPD